MTNRMQFTVTGSKARHREVEIDVRMLLTNSRRALKIRQLRRVIHADYWLSLSAPFEKCTEAVIEIEGVFPN
jgi:hypothetical protein